MNLQGKRLGLEDDTDRSRRIHMKLTPKSLCYPDIPGRDHIHTALAPLLARSRCLVVRPNQPPVVLCRLYWSGHAAPRTEAVLCLGGGSEVETIDRRQDLQVRKRGASVPEPSLDARPQSFPACACACQGFEEVSSQPEGRFPSIPMSRSVATGPGQAQRLDQVSVSRILRLSHALADSPSSATTQLGFSTHLEQRIFLEEEGDTGRNQKDH